MGVSNISMGVPVAVITLHYITPIDRTTATTDKCTVSCVCIYLLSVQFLNLRLFHLDRARDAVEIALPRVFTKKKR